MSQLQQIKRKWSGRPAIVAAPGPSLTNDVVEIVDTLPDEWVVLAVQDAYRLMPWADVLYGCDERWWDSQAGCMDFGGEKFSTHDQGSTSNDKRAAAEKYNLTLVKGSPGVGFSLDQNLIHYGDNSGFQALNLAVLFGSPYIVLVGFDMRHVGGKGHFFGDHKPPLFQRNEYQSFAKHFDKAPPPDGVTIINATPDSALTCYPKMDLETAIENHSLYRNRAVSHTGTG